MDQVLHLDIDFNQNHTVNNIVVKKTIAHNFFYTKSFETKDGKVFSIKSITGPFNVYDIDLVDTKEVVSATFYHCKTDPRPFVLCIKKHNNRKVYYSITHILRYNWEPIHDLNEVENELQEAMVLYVLKVMFSNFFKTHLNINESSITDGKTVSGEITYKIKPEIYFSNEYDRYKIKADKPNSIDTIFFEGRELKFNGNLKFVQELYIYFVDKDLTTPLLIETHDYEIGDDLALYNYYVINNIFDNKWVNIDSGMTYSEPLCSEEIIRILEEAVRKYKRHPVIFNIKEQARGYYIDSIVMFSGVTFKYINHNRHKFIYQEFEPKVSRSFYIQEILFNDIDQEVEIQSMEVSQLFVFYTDDEIPKPILISCKLYKSSEMNSNDFRWFQVTKCGSNVWKKIDFICHPQWDPDKIRTKIESICGYKIIPRDTKGSIFWAGLLTLGCIVGITFGARFSQRIILFIMRLYRRLIG